MAAALSTHRGTISPAPSFAYAYAAERVKAEHLAGQDLSSWRLALDALTPVYGLSEATLAVTFTPPGRGWRARLLDPAALASRGEVVDGSREVVSVGLPLPGLDVAERGEDGKELPERRLGRIFVRGGSVMQGYLGQLDATARTLPDGWLDTGDLSFLYAGELYVHGRAVLERTGLRAHTIEILAPETLPRTSSGKLRRADQVAERVVRPVLVLGGVLN